MSIIQLKDAFVNFNLEKESESQIINNDPN